VHPAVEAGGFVMGSTGLMARLTGQRRSIFLVDNKWLFSGKNGLLR